VLNPLSLPFNMLIFDAISPVSSRCLNFSGILLCFAAALKGQAPFNFIIFYYVRRGERLCTYRVSSYIKSSLASHMTRFRVSLL